MKNLHVFITIIACVTICNLVYCDTSQGLSDEQKIVAMTILGEARNQGQAGMYAVACVIAERSISWKKTPKQVCLKKFQFSCWNENDPNRRKLPHLLNTKEGQYAKALAINLNKLNRNYIKNADHYCHINKNPYWSYKTILKNGQRIKTPIKPLLVIGKHKFYKLR
mgnify:FL=1|tara:strand:- start:1110 stop:1607 length:498 start_codon:yes stop_codon:yes gene_type:complete